MTKTAIALGSNIGDAAANIRAAFARLEIILDDARLSRLYASPPMYRKDQDWFVNAVAVGETELAPQALLEELKAIEKTMGRLETFRNGPRLIDLDILFFADQIIEEEGLRIPHSRMMERPFVLYPLRDLEADWTHPLTKRSIAEMIESLPKDELYALA